MFWCLYLAITNKHRRKSGKHPNLQLFSPETQVTGTSEYWSRKNGSSKVLSEQNLVDCVSENKGCNGGDVRLAYRFTVAKGIANDTLYPYEMAKKTCRSSSRPSVYKPPNALFLELHGDENVLQDLLERFGPLSVAIINDAVKKWATTHFIISDTNFNFTFYSSGVLNDPSCSSSSKTVNHAVVSFVCLLVDLVF